VIHCCALVLHREMCYLNHACIWAIEAEIASGLAVSCWLSDWML